MPRQKSKEALFNELVDIVDRLNVFSMGGLFNEFQSSLYDHKGDGIGHGELALRTKIRNIIGSGFDEMKFGGKKSLDLHDVDVEALDRRVLLMPRYGQDIKACVDGQFRDEGSHDAVGRLRFTLGRTTEREYINELLTSYIAKLTAQSSTHTLQLGVLEDLACGTLSMKQVKVIEKTSIGFATLIRNTLSATNLTKRYPEGIQVVNRHGHIGVPIRDYADAFECAGIAKGVVKYRLSRSYIERRMVEALALVSQDIPNCIGINAGGHQVDEPIVVADGEQPTTVFT